MSILEFSHFGLCVSDLEKSLRFYCEGLGFEKSFAYDVGNEAKKSLEIDGDVALTSQFIARDGFTVELLFYTAPGVHGEPSKSRNQLGLTHMALKVDDIDAVGKKLVEFGGTALESTNSEMPLPDGGVLKLAFFADPDGGRVELMQQVKAQAAV